MLDRSVIRDECDLNRLLSRGPGVKGLKFKLLDQIPMTKSLTDRTGEPFDEACVQALNAGKAAYEAYFNTCGTYTQRAAMNWDTLPRPFKEAWVKAALAARLSDKG